MSKIKLGAYNTLTVLKIALREGNGDPFGLYLDGGPAGEILMPQKYVPEGTEIGDELEVFVYLDQDERPIATTEEPLAQVGDFAYLECSWVNEYGAFLSWGVMKDLFCPFREQYPGLIYEDQVFQYVHTGDRLKGYISTVRRDGKIDCTLQPTGQQHAEDFAETLLQYLKDNDGVCDLGDKSEAEDIKRRFQISKKVYKRAVGDLYKRHLITIEPLSIRIVSEG